MDCLDHLLLFDRFHILEDTVHHPWTKEVQRRNDVLCRFESENGIQLERKTIEFSPYEPDSAQPSPKKARKDGILDGKSMVWKVEKKSMIDCMKLCLRWFITFIIISTL
jgi:hypothetical protein